MSLKRNPLRTSIHPGRGNGSKPEDKVKKDKDQKEPAPAPTPEPEPTHPIVEPPQPTQPIAEPPRPELHAVGDGAATSSPPEDVMMGTIPEVMAWVGSDYVRAKQALRAERSHGSPRSTLLARLTELIEHS